MYCQSQSLFHIAGCKSDPFRVRVDLCQDGHFLPVLVRIFIEKISRHSQVAEGLKFSDLQILSLLFADDSIKSLYWDGLQPDVKWWG